jgi:hypothetical protein
MNYARKDAFFYLGICSRDATNGPVKELGEARTSGRCAHAYALSRNIAEDFLKIEAKVGAGGENDYMDFHLHQHWATRSGVLVLGWNHTSKCSVDDEGKPDHRGIFYQDRCNYPSDLDSMS